MISKQQSANDKRQSRPLIDLDSDGSSSEGEGPLKKADVAISKATKERDIQAVENLPDMPKKGHMKQKPSIYDMMGDIKSKQGQASPEKKKEERKTWGVKEDKPQEERKTWGAKADKP